MQPTTFWRGTSTVDLPYLDLRTKMAKFVPDVLFNNPETWKPYDSKNGIELFTQHPQGEPALWSKGTTTLPIDVDTSRSILANFETRQKWDQNFISGEFLKFWDPNHCASLTKFKAPWPFQPREMLTFSEMSMMPNPHRPTVQSFIFWSSSVELEGFPETEDTVRGNLYFLCYSLTPNAENENHTDVIYCVSQSPRGNIPDSVITSVTSKLPMVLATILDLCKKTDEVTEIKNQFLSHCQKVVQEYESRGEKNEKQDGEVGQTGEVLAVE